MSGALTRFESGLSEKLQAKGQPAHFAAAPVILAILQYVILPLLSRWLCPNTEQAVVSAFRSGKGRARYEKAVRKHYFGGSKRRYREGNGDAIVEAWIANAKATSEPDATELVRSL